MQRAVPALDISEQITESVQQVLSAAVRGFTQHLRVGEREKYHDFSF
jgi:hypothetical protein